MDELPGQLSLPGFSDGPSDENRPLSSPETGWMRSLRVDTLARLLAERHGYDRDVAVELAEASLSARARLRQPGA